MLAQAAVLQGRSEVYKRDTAVYALEQLITAADLDHDVSKTTTGLRKMNTADPSKQFLLNPKEPTKPVAKPVAKPVVPYFVSTLLFTVQQRPTDFNGFMVCIAYIDAFLHATAWTTAVTMDAVLIANEVSTFVMPAYVLMYAAFVSVSIAGGVVVLLSLYSNFDTINVLPASFTSLITGLARASTVFTALTLAVLSIEFLFGAAIETYEPAAKSLGHVMRMLVTILTLKMFGVAATVNNHRLEISDVRFGGGAD